MFRFIKQVLIGLLCFSKALASIVNTSDHIKCIPLNNQQYMSQPTVISLHPTEFLEGLRDYLFSVNLDRSMGSCNTPNDLSNKVCVPSKTKDLNLSVFNMITGINKNINKTYSM